MGAGVSFVMLQAVNTELRVTLGSAAWGRLIRLLAGTVCMLMLAVAMGEAFPPAAAIFGTDWRSWSGWWLSGKRAVAGPVRATARVASSGCCETPGANNVG